MSKKPLVTVQKRGGQLKNCQVKSFRRSTARLFPDNIKHSDADLLGGYLGAIMKQEDLPTDKTSKQKTTTGVKRHPFNFRSMIAFQVHNVHHSACIDAKTKATVGLGHESDKVKKALDPLCPVSWSVSRLAGNEDFWSVGNWWMEVVWNAQRTEILGLHPVAAASVHRYVDSAETKEYHWIVSTPEGEQHYAAWGDLLNFKARRGDRLSIPDAELIHIPDPSSASKYYGAPNHLAAIASIELVQALMQYQFDFFVNRGVPEFMLFIMGGKVDDPDWKRIEDALDAQIGSGKSHKTIAVNLPDLDLTVQLEKLAMEGTQDGSYFADMMETLSLNIVSAHRVPPSLAGIMIPGKMGAANETSNAIMLFQSLVIGSAHETIEGVFDATLGDPKRNGQLDLKPGDFAFKTIVDEIAEQMKKLAPADTMGRMKDELGDAASEGRNIEDGLQKQLVFVAKVLKAMKDAS